MFVLVDKNNKKGYISNSKKEISKMSGISYSSLSYYARRKFKGYYESDEVVFFKDDIIKGKQGGKREKSFE
jgi:hypothetical protein